MNRRPRTRIDPLALLGPDLLKLENPARYLGGEYGQVRKYPAQADWLMGIAFPDSYEIGMSNTAIKLIYALANRLEGVGCERVFTPHPDAEALLRARGIPLHTLESGIPLNELDMLGFSIGFELSITNVLTMLDLGGIALRSANRAENAPLVIAGGPVLTNPLPFGPFFDGIVIGEAEACLGEILAQQRQLSAAGVSRAERVAALEAHPAVWSAAKAARGQKARRVAWQGFTEAERLPAFPVPSIKIIQDYASLEIMRGCPQGCRFCHAGLFYRPYRQKPAETIAAEVAAFVCEQGYRDVSMASLSSGDYPEVARLYRQLNKDWAPLGVAFAMPSLKVNSFTLPLLAEMSQVKKSGLTFAVETASELGQHGLNKEATLANTLAIMRQAKELGWKTAKLYFMVGLPVPGQDREIEGIQEFLATMRKEIGINLNVTVGTFVPKPHTPFQWAGQLDPEAAYAKLSTLKTSNRDPKIAINYQSTFYSYLEGVVTRGDARVADLIEAAWRKGARFDGWDDRMRKDIWQEVIANADWDVHAAVCGGFPLDAPLPWDSVSLGLSPAFIKREWERSQQGILTERCLPDCGLPCGMCNSANSVVDQGTVPGTATGAAAEAPLPFALPAGWVGPRIASSQGDEREVPGLVFGFTKHGSAAYIPHLGLAQVLERALMRGGIPFRLSPGFSPHPVMELSQALSLGLESDEEIALIQLHREIPPEDFVRRMDAVLPDGIRITRAMAVPALIGGRKRPSLGSLHAGAVYALEVPPEVAARVADGLAVHGIKLPADGKPVTVSLLAKPGPSSLRQLFEPLLGPDWQSSGIHGRRLRILAHLPEGLIRDPDGFDCFDAYDLLLREGW